MAKLGFTSAAIYGSLSPAVRRREAERFRDGSADVLIATDAIGLGLNLPIRRLIFSAIEKFDGVADRLLTPYEIRQIAGRAGRFGIHEDGQVSALNAASHSVLATQPRRPRTGSAQRPDLDLADRRPSRTARRDHRHDAHQPAVAVLPDARAARRRGRSAHRRPDRCDRRLGRARAVRRVPLAAVQSALHVQPRTGHDAREQPRRARRLGRCSMPSTATSPAAS